MQISVKLNFNNQLYYGDNFSRQQSKPWKIIEALTRTTMVWSLEKIKNSEKNIFNLMNLTRS